jgi:hypothetical protein
MSTEQAEHLRGTLAYLESKSTRLKREYDEVQQVILLMRKELEIVAEALPKKIVGTTPPVAFAPGVYKGLSVRWSVFYFMAEHTPSKTVSSATIVEALLKGGLTTTGTSFSSNVSSVLSQMTNADELTKTDEGFTLTAHGSEIWSGIRRNPKFLYRNSEEGD